MKRVHNRLQRDYPDVDFILDDAAHDIHKLTTPGDPDPQRVEDLYIVYTLRADGPYVGATLQQTITTYP